MRYLLMIFLVGCGSVEIKPTIPDVTVNPFKCETVEGVVKRSYKGSKGAWSDEVKLPATGSWFTESHISVKGEKFAGKNFPSSLTENIDAHLTASCGALKIPCDKLFTNKWMRQWTPPENGKAGQGTRGETKPSAEEERFIFNMMFASQPKMGEKWLMSNGDKYVVVVGGYEVGPGDKTRLGGVQPEAAYFLGIKSGDKATIHGPLVDQTLKPGPIECK